MLEGYFWRTKMNANEFFVIIWNSISNVVNYNNNWGNGTEYLDNATEVSVPKDEIFKFTDEFGRKGVLIGTRFGTVVVFQRINNYLQSPVVFNIPESRTIKTLMGRDNPLSLETLENITGMYAISWRVCSHGTNIGATIEAIAKDFE